MTFAGITRRLQPLFLKVRGKLPHCPSSAVLASLNPRLIGVYPPEMKIEVVAEDGEFKKLRFDGVHETWFPRATQVNPELWNEYLSVFWEHSANGHYYLARSAELAAGSVVIDCGACEGFFVHQALALKAAKIICIEPNPALVCCLEKTFAAEIRTGRVVIKPVALGAFQGRAAFGFDAAYPAFGQFGVSSNSATVPVETIASICHDLNLDRVDFLKMDLEGAELQTIEGALPVLRRFHPQVAVTTYHRIFDYICLRAMLRAAGYRDFIATGLTEFGQPGQFRPVMLHAN